MPIYQYKCQDCGYVIELLVREASTDDDMPEKCPMCGGALSKMLSAGVTVVFRGHGFYETDYKKHK